MIQLYHRSSTGVKRYRSCRGLQGYRGSALVEGCMCITEVHLLYRGMEIVQLCRCSTVAQD